MVSGAQRHERQWRRRDAREFHEPVLLDDGEIAHEALGGLDDLVKDDPARRRLAREEHRGRVDVQDLCTTAG